MFVVILLYVRRGVVDGKLQLGKQMAIMYKRFVFRKKIKKQKNISVYYLEYNFTGYYLKKKTKKSACRRSIIIKGLWKRASHNARDGGAEQRRRNNH